MKWFLLLALMWPSLAFAQSIVENKEIDRIEVLDNGLCQVRQKIEIVKDGVVLATSYHRWVIEPEDAMANLDAEVPKAATNTRVKLQTSVTRAKSICRAGWTPATIKKYKDFKKAEAARFGGK